MNSPLVRAIEAKALKYLSAIDQYFEAPAVDGNKERAMLALKTVATGTNQRKSENGSATQYLKAAQLGIIPANSPMVWNQLTGGEEPQVQPEKTLPPKQPSQTKGKV